jgi:RimJ/RimL family protein N-acetyltransferase
VRKFEVGYWIRPEAAGQGHVSEAVRLLTVLAFGPLDARRVEIRCDTRNTRSRAVAERCGFALEGVLRCDSLGVDGRPRDTCVYAQVARPTDAA